MLELPVSSRRPLHFSLLLAVAASSLVLAACGDKAVTSPANSSKPAAASPAQKGPSNRDTKAADPGQQMASKLNAYTDVYNNLIGTFGLSETRESYFDKNIIKRNASDSLSITDGWLEGPLESLKKARALPSGGNDVLEAPADALIAALDKLVTQLKDLKVYYASKAYKNDNLSRGKAEDPVLRANFEATTAALKTFNSALGVEQKKSDAQLLAKLKASGNLVAYNTKLAIGQGEELVSLFGGTADIKNAAKYVQGDALVAELEKTLAQQREQFAAAKGKETQPDSGHESTASNLVSLVGAYRDMKQSRKAEDFNGMVKEYNRAVESANRIR